MKVFLCILTLATLVAAEQPGATAPITGPQRGLPLGQLNFLQTTDIHGWHSGHLNQGQYSADFGDYFSFVERMRQKADAVGADLVVVDTGDRIDGNGLYDASKPKGLYTYDLIKQVDYDVLILGNHELYENSSVEAEYTKLAPVYKEKFISSNVDYIDPETGKQISLGQRYRIFRTKNQGIKIAALGFIFSMTNNANNSVIQRVEDTVKEDWFQAVIREDVDLFLICGHFPLDQAEFDIIFKAIRYQKKDTPIQMFGAHTHIRNFKKYDSNAYGLQSGQYMETIGWASVNGLKKNASTSGGNNEISFRRRYIDNNILAYHFHTGLNTTTFPTDHGKKISSLIHTLRQKLNLDYTYGCVPRDFYFKSSNFPRNDSILTWLAQDVLPDIVKTTPSRTHIATMILLNTGYIRYDLNKGSFTSDTTYIITPFKNEFRYIKNVPYDAAIQVYNRLNSDKLLFSTGQNTPILHTKSHPSSLSRAQSSRFKSRSLRSIQSQISFTSGREQPALVPGYTTVDDGGSDGDDTLHIAPGNFIDQQNVIYAPVQFPGKGDPKRVDFVFSQYIQIPVLTAFNDRGVRVNISDVELYREETIDVLIVEWVKKNWPGKC